MFIFIGTMLLGGIASIFLHFNWWVFPIAGFVMGFIFALIDDNDRWF